MRLALEECHRILATLTPHVLGELERRGRETAAPDGFPSGGDGTGRASSTTSGTERAALQRFGRVRPDATYLAFLSMRNNLDKVWEQLIRIEDAWISVQVSDAQKRERQTSLAICEACGRDDVTNVGEDRIRSGYCPACYQAWNRAGRQDRVVFEQSRRDVVTSG